MFDILPQGIEHESYPLPSIPLSHVWLASTRPDILFLAGHVRCKTSLGCLFFILLALDQVSQGY